MSTLRRFRTTRTVALAAAVLTWGGLGLADDRADEADLQFELGAERYEQNDFKGALEHFLASNRLVPNRNVVFNIARTYEQLRRAPDAYRYYVLASEGETNPVSQKRITDALARITPRVAILKVASDPPGATIYLDRVDLGPRGDTPRTLGLPDGKRKVFLQKAGYEPLETVVDLKTGKESKLELKMKPILAAVRFDGEPGAQVRMDDERAAALCTVPCTAQVPFGRHVFHFTKEGFQPGEVPADVTAKGTTTVRARLSTQTGTVVVSSEIRDALITIDGAAVGFTPTVLKVPVGKHELRVIQQGYRPFVQDFELSLDQEIKIDADLSSAEEVSAASRVTESIEDAPASVTIIPAQELRAMGYPTVADAVRGVRGLYLSDDRSYTSIGFRGFARPGDYGNRVLVLLDGQPMNDNYIWSSYVGTDGRMDIDDLDRIEVIRGPGSVLYGSSAFFGVINLVTRSRNAPTHGEVSLSTFDSGLGRARATAVVRLSPDAGFWATVTGLQGEGREFYFPEYRSDPGDPRPTLDASGQPADGRAYGNDRQWGGMVTGRLWYKTFTVQWFMNARRKFLPTAEYDTIFNDPRTRFVDSRGLVEARFEPKLSDSFQSLSRAHVNMCDFDGFYAYQPEDGGPQRDTYRGRWGGAEQRFVYTPSEELRLTVGGEVVQHFVTRQEGVNAAGADLLDAEGRPGRNDPFTVGAAYVNADVRPIRALKVVAGARLDYYSDLPVFEFFPAFNPRLAFVVKPYDRGNLKIIGAKAFRSPSVYELHYSSVDQAAPSRLSPEQIYSGEVELTHRFSDTVSATIAGYSNYVKDLVVLKRIPSGQVQYQNSREDVSVFGGEVEVRRDWRQGWMLSASYSYQNAQYQGDGGLRSVPNSLEHLASLKGAAPILGRALKAMTRLSIEGPRADRNEEPTAPPQGSTPTGVIWDLVFSGDVERIGLRYAVGIYNAMDWRYASVPSSEFRQSQIVQAGRTLLATTTLSF